MKFILSLPPTLNHTYRMGNGKFYKDVKAVNWEQLEGWKVKQKKPLLGAIEIDIWMYLKRDRDIDSSLKIVLDLLAKGRVYENDSQITDLTVFKIVDKDNPRLEVKVSELKDL